MKQAKAQLSNGPKPGHTEKIARRAPGLKTLPKPKTQFGNMENGKVRENPVSDMHNWSCLTPTIR